MAGTGLFSPLTSVVDVALNDNDTLGAELAKCVGDPVSVATEAGAFAPGCLMIRTDNGQLYTNMGTAAVPDWNSLSAVSNAELSVPKIGVVQADITLADFVDNEDATGTYTFTDLIPAGAVVMQSTISAVTGFAGDTTAVITIGDTDVDRYNTGTPTVFATAAHISAGAVSGTAYNLTAVTPLVVLTAGTDFGDVTAGAMTITIFYFTV